MRLAIDCRFSQKSGIGTYIDNIVDCLLQYYPDNQYLLVCNRRSRFKQTSNVKIIGTDIKPFSIQELIKFPVEEINKCDAFFTPYINIPGRIKVPIYSTIHDVVFLDIEGLVSTIGKIVRRFYYKRAIKLSKKIFTVSQFSKDRILHHFPTEKEIIISCTGISKTLKVYAKGNVVKRDYFIFVGNIKKHKGLQTLIRAFQIATSKGLSSKLLIVGSNEKFRTSDESLGNAIKNTSGIEFTGWVTDNQLLELISEAKALVQPSLYEGFGLPPLEALCLGTNAIISDIQVFREIYNKMPVTFFRANDANDLAHKMINFEIKDINQDLSNSLMEKFGFQRVAKCIINIINPHL